MLAALEAQAAESALQWGRAQMSAEIRPIPSLGDSANELQWGRAQMSAEMRRWWRGGCSRTALQWGRAQMSAEMYLKGDDVPAGVSTSMGPRSDERGNYIGSACT